MKTAIQKTIALALIVVGKLNPRKDFDEESIKELHESIKENGILQPLLVRPIEGGKYELVCGERRLRASKLAELKEVPVMIKELTDDEAIEAMIIENLQRKGVSDMEEAEAFGRLVKYKGKTIQDIALTVGKPLKFVATRIKLNELIPEFKKALLEKKMDVELGLRLCVLTTATQKLIWKEEDCEGDDEININSYRLNQYTSNLESATFDLEDKTLSKVNGSCLGCIHNTASNTLLFPDEKGVGMCQLAKCFVEKSKKHYENELKKAIEDPEVILVAAEHEESNETKALKKTGAEVLVKGYEGSKKTFDVVEVPVAMTREDWDDENEHENEDLSPKEIDKAWETYLKEIDKEKNEHEENIKNLVYKKAFIATGNGQGKYVLIKLLKGEKNAKEAVQGNMAVNLKAEIARIEGNEKRKKELDNEKVQIEYHVALQKNKGYISDKALTKTELIGQVMFLYSMLGYLEQKEFDKVTKYKHDKNCFYVELSKESPSVLAKNINRLTRMLIVDKCSPFKGQRSDNSHFGMLLQEVAKESLPIQFKKINEEQKAICEQREIRVKERIDKLKKQK